MRGRTSNPRLVWAQIRYHNRRFWRTPIAAFFTLVFPLMFLILFNLLFGGTIETGEGEISIAQFFAPALAVFAAASATYTNLGVSTAIDRDNRILKRIRGTPLPTWIYMAGAVGSGVWIAFLAVVLMMTVGVLVYDVTIDWSRIPAALLTFLVGVGAFAALGLAVAGLVPSGDAAPAVTNATLLPVAFVSDVFIPIPPDAPVWLATLGNIFPLRHFVVAFQDAFSPNVTDSALRWDDLAVMAVWGLVGLVVAVRFFKWEPTPESRLARRRARRELHAESG